jgi:hypothetical protein
MYIVHVRPLATDTIFMIPFLKYKENIRKTTKRHVQQISQKFPKPLGSTVATQWIIIILKNLSSLLSHLSIHANCNPYLIFFFIQAPPLLTGSSIVASPPHIGSLFSHGNPILFLPPSISLWVTSFLPFSSHSLSFLSCTTKGEGGLQLVEQEIGK